MSAAAPSLAEERAKIYAVAEKRLGRKLTKPEQRLDLLGADRDLARAKKRVHAAIEKEKSRVIRARLLHNTYARMGITDEMERALLWLYERSRRYAIREMHELGREPVRAYESPSLPLRVRFVIDRLRGLLGGLQARVDRESEGALVRDLGTETRLSLVRALELQLPGALNAAGMVVSPTFGAGRAAVWEANQHLVDGWQISGVMDGNQCEACAEIDGQEFATLDEAMQLMGGSFGPFIGCYGGSRCRCTILPIAAAVAA